MRIALAMHESLSHEANDVKDIKDRLSFSPKSARFLEQVMPLPLNPMFLARILEYFKGMSLWKLYVLSERFCSFFQWYRRAVSLRIKRFKKLWA
jgi:hypothetical protein